MTCLPRLGVAASAAALKLRGSGCRMAVSPRSSSKAFALFALFALYGCGVHAATPKPLDITEQRNAAVGYAVTAALAVRRMAIACKAVPVAAAAFSDSERQWDARNGAYFEAAVGWLAYVKQVVAAQQGSKVAGAVSERTRKTLVQSAIKMVAEAVPGNPPLAADCQQWADVLNSGQFDLARNAKFANDLHDIWVFHQAVTATYDP